VYIRTRLAVLVILLVGATLALVGTATYKLLRHGLLTEIERDVARRATTFAASRPQPPYPVDVFAAPDVFLQVVDAGGTPVAGSGNLGGRVLPLDDRMRAGEVVESRVGGRPLFLTAALLPDGTYIIVARSPITIYGALRQLRGLLYTIIGVALVVAGVLSWIVARAALRPVERVAAAAEAVKRGRDLRQRVTYAGPPDELGRLAATFNAMLAELDAAYRQLDESNQRLRQFLADCAHELRTPLTLITGSLDLLARMGETDPAFAAQALADIREEADRMARMITQLLLLGRADAGAQIARKPVRLTDTIVDVCRQGQAMAEGIRFVNGVGDTIIGVMVDGHPDYLKQLLLILVDNACKYTQPPGEVRIEAVMEDGRVRLSVFDTGTGIDPGDLPRIFDRFYRGKNATGTTGTGLGLAIARWVAEQHGGTIEVESAPGRGSRFSVLLPVAAQGHPAA
jgi:signal transduction histidine kinase